MGTVQRELEKFKIACPLAFDYSMAELTTFRVGGPADILARPRTVSELQEVLEAARATGAPLTILGGGANVVVSDAGIRGVTVVLTEMRDVGYHQEVLRAEAGAPISDVAAQAATWELSGLEFIYAMPGSVGGAVWMNARCYGGEIAPILRRVEYVTLEGKAGVYEPRPGDFAYKVSPFQSGGRIITAAEFNLKDAPGTRDAMWRGMRDHEEDRRAKGHFTYPCAGSIFKNNRAFGRPSGRIIDEAGLRGLRRGGASVFERHGNIIVNDGGARAADIRALVEEVRERVYRTTGFDLEPEVLFVGDWP